MSLNLIVEAIERFRQLVEQHYKEPVNGQFEDCRKEMLPGVKTESSSDEEHQNITTMAQNDCYKLMCNDYI